MTTQFAHRFPTYTTAERAVDGAVHAVGVPAGVIAASWLVAAAVQTEGTRVIITLLIYAIGLVGMLSASAAYNLARPGRLKAWLQRTDHAMIFVMIAGSYTPFALNALDEPDGVILCVVVWVAAAAGIGLKLLAEPHRFERLSLGLYLGMGWLVVGMLRSFIERLPHDSLLLLVAGGLVYSIGAVVHAIGRVPYHNAAWHVLVLVGAGMHLAALHTAFVPSI
jgi:hemolysin III